MPIYIANKRLKEVIRALELKIFSIWMLGKVHLIFFLNACRNFRKHGEFQQAELEKRFSDQWRL